MANPTVSYLSAGAATDTANDTNITSGSVSPTGDALLLVMYAGNGGHTISSFSTTLSTSGSWYGPYTVDQGTQTVAIGAIKLAATPGTGTVSATLSSKTNRKAIQLAEATGYDTTTPLLNTTSNTATGSSTTPSVTLTSVNAGNTTFGAVCAANSPTPDQGVELGENGGSAGIPYLASMADETSPGNTVSWTMTSGAWAAAAFEIKAEAGAVTHESDVVMSGAGVASGSGIVTAFSDAVLLASGTLQGQGTGTSFAQAVLIADSSLAARGFGISSSDASLVALGALIGSGQTITVGNSRLYGTGELTATGQLILAYLPYHRRTIPRRRRLYP